MKSYLIAAVCLVVSGCAVTPEQYQAMQAYQASGVPPLPYAYSYEGFRASKQASQVAPLTCYTIHNGYTSSTTCY